ncbi:MAG: prolyl oligopeptidase family serine peptidase [Tannerella sp.]|jgi:hypothetical protein|nr:prolyl oligopeptidase family serine peptidase [Tannerella sp.]
MTCKIYTFIIIAAIASSIALRAQNVINPYGLDKVEKTEEGAILHHFTQGLVLPAQVNPGVLYNGQDMIAWLYAVGKFVSPAAGDSVPYAYPSRNPAPAPSAGRPSAGRPAGAFTRNYNPPPMWKWTSVEADSTGTFQNPTLRSAYLYTAYTADKEQLLLLETTGGTRTYVNGVPHEGDHYDFGYTLIPLKLRRGKNDIIYTPGRFGRVKSKLVRPDKPVMFTRRDMTLPDLIIGDNQQQWAAIRVINLTEQPLRGYSIRAILRSGRTIESPMSTITALTVRKIKFLLPNIPASDNDNIISDNDNIISDDDNIISGDTKAILELLDKAGKLVDRTEINLKQVSALENHTRTFLSNVDHSVQFYSVTPAKRTRADETRAMALTVHGAGVDAHTQAGCYEQKDWIDVVAATNRRPFGFNWEEWGRIDALEVLEHARSIYHPYDNKIYLTGHSMGGHGTWYLGTTYPDKFAAIAPCAAYPDIATYGRGQADDALRTHPLYSVFETAANAGRTLTMIENLKQSGVYIFHGSEDRTVPTDQARRMREVLSRFHSDFCYYEYPGGEHWFGNICMDWFPIFEFFARHTIPSPTDVKDIDFRTASPGVSSTDYWIEVEQQTVPLALTRIKASCRQDSVHIQTSNAALIAVNLPALQRTSPSIHITIDSQTITVPSDRKALLARSAASSVDVSASSVDVSASSSSAAKWRLIDSLDTHQKYSARYGGFKYAINNNVVFVYATHGSAEENEWYRSKALFDAETFYYRGNGSIDVIPDKDYTAAKYPDRNVILFGNRNNNLAWRTLLATCPIQVSRGLLTCGDQTYRGDDLATYFVYPHPTSATALVGVIGGTGPAGMRALSPNNYISGITGFPDYMIFRAETLRTGLDDVLAAGFFNNEWK